MLRSTPHLLDACWSKLQCTMLRDFRLDDFGSFRDITLKVAFVMIFSILYF